MQILTLVSRGVLPPRLPEQTLSDEAWDLIQRCWVREPLKRPTMKEVTASMPVEILQEALSPSPTPSSTLSLSTTSRKRQRAYYIDESDDNSADSEFSNSDSLSKQQQNEHGLDRPLIHAQQSGYQWDHSVLSFVIPSSQPCHKSLGEKRRRIDSDDNLRSH